MLSASALDSVGQTEGLSIGAFNNVIKSGHVGRVVGEQCAVGSQSQREATPNGFSESQQSVRASQFTEISGGPASDVKVNSGVGISLSQSQFVGGGN